MWLNQIDGLVIWEWIRFHMRLADSGCCNGIFNIYLENMGLSI